MSRKKAVLRIILKSDLCVGSGYSHGGVIDSDICYSEQGIPYIPGRRLKGCLKEAGEMMGLENLEKVFGSRGNDKIQGIVIQNAYPKGYWQIQRKLKDLKKSGSPYAAYLTQQKVLEQYTRIKTETAIDNSSGTAKENSLRYTRVVSQYACGTLEPMNFFAEMEFDCEEAIVVNLAKAVRHIGMSRNRGLGNVECRVEQIQEIKAESIESTVQGTTSCIRLDYALQNISPLMMSGNSDKETQDFISGQSVLGVLANTYLQREGNSAEDDLFQEMFLKGKVLFTNLNISSPKKDAGYNRYEPAPLFIQCLKKTGKLINIAKDEQEREAGKQDADFKKENGNLPKKLNGKYISFHSDGKLHLMEPEKDIIYHHSRKQQTSAGEKGVLYALEAIREGQYFSGSIIAEEKYIRVIKSLMAETRFGFGKSKSAQYGSCNLVWVKESVYSPKLELKAGEKILVALVSNGIFLEENTGYTIQYKQVRKILAENLGLSIEEELEEKHTYLQSAVLGGYHTLWNLKKPSIPSIKAGSVFEYQVKEDCTIVKEFVGEKNLEGFGEIRIYREDDMDYVIREYQETIERIEPKESLEFLERILMSALADSMKAKVFETDEWKTSPSTLGRVTLMLTESLDENKGCEQKAFENFMERVKSIKRESERKKIQIFLRKYLCTENDELDIGKMVSSRDGIMEPYRMMEELAVSSLEAQVKKMWGEYLMNILVYQKYLMKLTGGEQ